MSVEYTSLKDQVCGVLRGVIFRGEIMPGEKFSEKDIADILKKAGLEGPTGGAISRTPIRDAITTLMHEGIMEQIPLAALHRQKGFRIPELSTTEQVKLLKHRNLIEGFVASELARMSESDQPNLTILKKLMENMKKAAEEEDNEVRNMRFLESDMEFHKQFAVLAGYSDIADELIMLRSKIKIVGQQALQYNEEGIKDVLKEHEAILDAIVHRQPEAAQEAVTLHMKKIAQRLSISEVLLGI